MMIKTKRLSLEKLVLADAPFILDLLNRPEWIRFIGDRNVHDLSGAENYIINGPQKDYDKLGYGLFKVSLGDTAIGMCGLLKRDYLDHPDIGFAMLSEYAGQGYGFEAASATLDWAREQLGINLFHGITSPENERSIALLEKLGMQFDRMVQHKPGEASSSLYST